nr:immunoglobulin heavy chain junction region [Mus musculus]MBK4196408.1 immunoglobulin heavy chain junction region [Mus musculus]MBK4196409.1 immunoglobulin heavy chain junction region [Mus musculus]MBK4196410.1 immunoglobulin heavy chain junction region [Mus musculus]MBK4196411.1 immunoglobulin heavy chain junction region [Mus musculus]
CANWAGLRRYSYYFDYW